MLTVIHIGFVFIFFDNQRTNFKAPHSDLNFGICRSREMEWSGNELNETHCATNKKKM